MKCIFWILIPFLILSHAACNKDETTLTESEYTYPDSGRYGYNLLDKDKVVYHGTDFGFSGLYPANGGLEVKLISVSGGRWFLKQGTIHNWNVNSFDRSDQSQLFIAINESDTCNVRVEIEPGTYRVLYFEEGSTEIYFSKEMRIN